ncbi:MAG: GNAT family N-acetyltransferase [Chloroflexota bacterium]|nr:MAG: hypothetical protein DLM70_05180 [Chloroflexota bacterium]
MIVREAKSEDIPGMVATNASVQRLHAGAHPGLFKPPSPSADIKGYFARLLNDVDHRIYVAAERDRVLGYIFAQIFRRPENPFRYPLDLVLVHNVAVDPGCRRQGVGAALMHQVLDAAGREGIQRIELDMWSFNDVARAFFAEQGFVVFNERMVRELV